MMNLEEKQNAFRKLMENIWMEFDDLMKDIQFEGYTVKQDPRFINNIKGLWNNSMTLNDNISKLLFKDQASKSQMKVSQRSLGGALNGLNSDPLISSQKLYD